MITRLKVPLSVSSPTSLSRPLLSRVSHAIHARSFVIHCHRTTNGMCISSLTHIHTPTHKHTTNKRIYMDTYTYTHKHTYTLTNTTQRPNPTPAATPVSREGVGVESRPLTLHTTLSSPSPPPPSSPFPHRRTLVPSHHVHCSQHLFLSLFRSSSFLLFFFFSFS